MQVYMEERMAPHTYITIEDASTLLDKQYVTVKAASSRGVFTRVPVTSHQQSLVKEQVELFIGKKQLKLAALNRDRHRCSSPTEAPRDAAVSLPGRSSRR